jgi:hypothetical protein
LSESGHPLEQVADLQIGVAVVPVLELGTLSEERIHLAEQQDRVVLRHTKEKLASATP